jgi:ADP-ribosylglycohydrolase
MRYPRAPDYQSLSESLAQYAALKAEYGAGGIQPVLGDAERALRDAFDLDRCRELDFSTDDVGTAWLKYLPYACTAEDVALKNLKRGVPAGAAAERDNPFVQWIGADIRSDPWAFLAPGLPERAAEMAHRDARLSHRRNGIYGEMFFAAAQSAAFAVDDPVEALRVGLTEIPRGCALARDVRWALKEGRGIRGYADARTAVDERFKGMHWVHTSNNARLTVFGLMIGGTDVTRVISEVVAKGMDNDCTAATAGCIVGAVVGRRRVPAHWHRRFHDTVRSYLIGRPEFRIGGLIDRFARQAAKQFAGGALTPPVAVRFPV